MLLLFFFCPSFGCHVQALNECLLNGRILYLLIRNWLVIIRLSDTAAIHVKNKLMIFFSISIKAIQRMCMEYFFSPIQQLIERGIIFCMFFSPFSRFHVLSSSHFQTIWAIRYAFIWFVFSSLKDILANQHLDHCNRQYGE